MAGHLRWKHLDLPGRQLPEPAPRLPQAMDPGSEVGVNLVEGSLELLPGGRVEIPDAGKGDPSVGKGADLNQVDGVLRGVAPVAGGVTAGFWQKPLVVVDTDGLGRYTGVPGELANGDHLAYALSVDLALGARLQHVAMANMTPDRETLRALADEGNETALERLADLADARGDLDELSELLDEGSSRAGHLLTRRAVKVGDLLELQRLSDAGCGEAGDELERLLIRPADAGEG